MTEKIAPKVVIIEDDSHYSEIAKKNLEELGVVVVAVVENYLVALENIIPYLVEEGINYVLLDGNLSPGKYDGQEGLTLANEIKKQAPNVKIVGHSALGQDYVDIPLGKFGIKRPYEVRVAFNLED
jgi:DNA-binding NtrC family response regulator